MILFMSNADMPMKGDTSDQAKYYSKLLALMALGEMTGAIVFNAFFSAAKAFSNSYPFWCNRVKPENTALETLNLITDTNENDIRKMDQTTISSL